MLDIFEAFRFKRPGAQTASDSSKPERPTVPTTARGAAPCVSAQPAASSAKRRDGPRAIEYEEPRRGDAAASTTGGRGDGGVQRLERGLSHRFKKRRANDTAGPAAPTKPPAGWEDVLAAISQHREYTPASVDEFHDFLLQLRNNPEPHFECLVAALLSVQVRDAVALAAMKRLQNLDDVGYVTVQRIVDMPVETLEGALSTLNYFRSKARNLKAIAERLRVHYGGRVPESVDALMSLPGVGPKIAHLVMSISFGRDAGIVVDTHVHRFAQRIGWVQHPDSRTLTAEHTRRSLEQWLPHDLWADFTLHIIGFAQTVCTPLRPKCGDCPLSEGGRCPSAFQSLSDEPAAAIA